MTFSAVCSLSWMARSSSPILSHRSPSHSRVSSRIDVVAASDDDAPVDTDSIVSILRELWPWVELLMPK